MAYQSWSVVFGEQPTAAKWNILGSNDASFNDGTGIADTAVFKNSKIGTIASTADGQASVTGLGFRPKELEMFSVPGDNSTQATDCRGHYDGTTQISFGIISVETGDSSRSSSTSHICFTPTANANRTNNIAINSLDADGFTYTVSSRTATITFYYIARG